MHQPGSFNHSGQGQFHAGRPPPPPPLPPPPPPLPPLPQQQPHQQQRQQPQQQWHQPQQQRSPQPQQQRQQQQRQRQQHRKREEGCVSQRGAARDYGAYPSHHTGAGAGAQPGLSAVRPHEEIVLSSGSSSGNSDFEDESRLSAQRPIQPQQQQRQQWQVQQQRDQWHRERKQLQERRRTEMQQHSEQQQQQQQQQREQQAQRRQPQPRQQEQNGEGPPANLAHAGVDQREPRDRQSHLCDQHQQEEHEQQRQQRQRSHQNQQPPQQQLSQNQGQNSKYQQRPQRGAQYLRMDYASAGKPAVADSTDTHISGSSSSSSSMNVGWDHSFHVHCSRLLPEFGGLIQWRSGRVQKALRIASAEDGVRVHEDDPDTFIVASDSTSCRLVDAAVCECSCPNPNPPCSHLLAVALWRPQRQKEQHQVQGQQAFRLRLAISTFVKQQLLRVATEAFVPLKPLTCEALLHALYQSLLRRHSAAAAARAAAGLAVGLLLRFAQNAQGSLPQIPSTARRDAQQEAEAQSVLDDEDGDQGGKHSQQQPQQEQQQHQQEGKRRGDGAADAAIPEPKTEVAPMQECSIPVAPRAAAASTSGSSTSTEPLREQVREFGYSVSIEEAMPRLLQELQRQQQALREGAAEDVLKQLHLLETAAFAAGTSSSAGTLLQLLQRHEARAAAAAVEELLQSRARASEDKEGPAVRAAETASVEVYVHFAALLLEAATAAAAAAAARGQGGAYATPAVAEQWLRQLAFRLVDLHFPPAAAAALQRTKPLADSASLRKFVVALQPALAETKEGILVHAEGLQAPPQRLLDLCSEQPLSAAVHETVAAELRRCRSSGIRPAAAICDPWRLAEALTAAPRFSSAQQHQQQQQYHQETPHLTSLRNQALHLLLSKPQALQHQQQRQDLQSRPSTSWQAVVQQIEGAPFLVDLCGHLNWHAELQPSFGSLDSFLSRHGHAPFAAASNSSSSRSSFRSLSDTSFFVASGLGEILRVPKPSAQTLQSLLHAISSRNSSAAVVDLASLLWRPDQGHLASAAELAPLSANPVSLQAHIRSHLKQLLNQQRRQQQQQEQEVQLWGNFCCQVLADAPPALVDSLAVVVVVPLCTVYGVSVLHAAIEAFAAVVKQQHRQQQESSSTIPPQVEGHLQQQLLFARAAFCPLSLHLRSALLRCAQLMLPLEELSGTLCQLQQPQQSADHQQLQLAQAPELCAGREEETSGKDREASSSRESSAMKVSAEATAAAVAAPQSHPMLLEERDELLLTSFGRFCHGLQLQGSAVQCSSGTPAATTAAASGTERAATAPETQEETSCWSGESPEAFVLRLRAEEFGVGVNSGGCSEGKETAIDGVMRRQRERLTRALGRLAGDLYASEGHLQLELLQNADDNRYVLPLNVPPLLQLRREQEMRQLRVRLSALQVPALHFELLPGGLCVFNNERGFCPQDLRSLCDVARSTKNSKQQHQQQQGGGGRRRIGRFGVGFKSVFSLSDEPHVFSRTGVAIKFSATDSSGLGFVLPHLLEWDDPSRYVPLEALRGALLAAADPPLLNQASSVCCCPEMTRSAAEMQAEDPTEAAAAAAAEAAASIWRTIIWLPVRPALRERWLGGDGGLAQRLSVVEPHCLLFLRQISRVSARSSLTRRCFLLSKETFSHINLASFQQQPQQRQLQLTQGQQVIPLPAHAQHVVLTSSVRRLTGRACNSCDSWGGCASKEGDSWQQRRHHWLLVQHTLKDSSHTAGPGDEPVIVALPLTPDGFAAASPAAAASDSGSSNSSSGSGADSVGWPVHCFLPVRGFGLPFILQGSFNLTASREDLRCGDRWNAWLLQQVPDAVFAALSVCRDAHPQLQESLLLFAPLLTAAAAGGGSAAMVADAAEAAVNGLKGLECLLAVSPQCSADDCVQRPRQQLHQSSEDCIWCCPRRAVLPCDLEEGEGVQGFARVDPEAGRSCSSSSSSRAGIAGLIPPWLLQEALGLLYVHPRVLRHVKPCVLRTLGARDLTLWDVVEVLRFLVSLHQQQEQQEPRPASQLLQPHWVGRLLLLIDSLSHSRGPQQQQQRDALRVLRSISFLPTTCGRLAAADAIEAPLCLPAAAAPGGQRIDVTCLFSEAAVAACPAAADFERCSSSPLVMYLHPGVLEPWAAEPARCQQQQEQQLSQRRQESMTQNLEHHQEDPSVVQRESDREGQAKLLGEQGLQRSRVLRCLRGLGVDSLRPQQLMKQRLLPLLEQQHFRDTATDTQLVRYLHFLVSNFRELEALMRSDRSSNSSSSIDSVIRQQVLLLPVCTHKAERVPLGCASLRVSRLNGGSGNTEQRLLHLYQKLLPDLAFLSGAYAEVVSLPSWGDFCDLLGLRRLLHVCRVEYRLRLGSMQQQQQQEQQQQDTKDQPIGVPSIDVVSVDGSPVTKGPTNSSSGCRHEELFQFLSLRWLGATWSSLQDELLQQGGEALDPCLRGRGCEAPGLCLLFKDFVCPDFERLGASAAAATSCCSGEGAVAPNKSFLLLPSQRIKQVSHELQQAEALSLRLLFAVLTEAQTHWQPYRSLRWSVADEGYSVAARSQQVADGAAAAVQEAPAAAAASRRGAVWALSTPEGTAASSLFLQLRGTAWLPAVACDVAAAAPIASAQGGSAVDTALFEIDCEGDDKLLRFSSSSSSSDSESELTGPSGSSTYRSLHKNRKRCLSAEGLDSQATASRETAAQRTLTTCARRPGVTLTGRPLSVSRSASSDKSPFADGDCLRCRGSSSNESRRLSARWHWRFVGLRRPCDIAAPTAECLVVYRRVVEYLHPLAAGLLQRHQQHQEDTGLADPAKGVASGGGLFASLADPASCLGTLTGRSKAAAGSAEADEGPADTDEWTRVDLADAAAWLGDSRRPLRAHAAGPTAAAASPAAGWQPHLELRNGLHFAPDAAGSAAVLVSLACMLRQEGRSSASTAAAGAASGTMRGNLEACDITSNSSTSLSFEKGSCMTRIVAPNVAACFFVGAAAACGERRCCCSELGHDCGARELESCCCLRQHCGRKPVGLFCCCCAAVAADVFHLLQYVATQRYRAASVGESPAAAPQQGFFHGVDVENLVLLPQPRSRAAGEGAFAPFGAYAGGSSCICWRPPSQTVYHLPLGASLHAFSTGWPLEDLSLLLRSQRAAIAATEAVRDPRGQVGAGVAAEMQRPYQPQPGGQQQGTELQMFLLRDLHVPEYPSPEACVAALLRLTQRFGECAADACRRAKPAVAAFHMQQQPPLPAVGAHVRPPKFRRFEAHKDDSLLGVAGAPGAAAAAAANCRGETDSASAVCLQVMSLLLHLHAQSGSKGLLSLIEGLSVIPCLQLSASSGRAARGVSAAGGTAAAADTASASAPKLQVAFLPADGPLWLQLTPADSRVWDLLRTPPLAESTEATSNFLITEQPRRLDRRRARGGGRRLYSWTADEASSSFVVPHVVWSCEASCGVGDLVLAAAASDCCEATGGDGVSCPLCGPCFAYRHRLQLQRHQYRQRGEIVQAWLKLLQHELGAEPLHSVCAMQLACALPSFVGPEARGLELISLGWSSGHAHEEGAGVLMRGLRERLLVVLLPAVRRYLLKHDPTRYVSLHQQWLTARQERTEREAGSEHAAEANCSRWLPQVERLLLLLCKGLLRRVCHLPSGATGPWTPCGAALQWEGLFEGEGDLPSLTADGSGKSLSETSKSTNNISNPAKGNDLLAENRWESREANTREAPFLLACSIEDQTLVARLMAVEQVTRGGQSHSRLADIFSRAQADQLQEVLLPSLPSDALEELSRLFSLKGGADGALAAFLSLLYSKLQHRLLQWLLRNCSGGSLQWLQRLQRNSSTSGCCYGLTTIAVASIVEPALAEYLEVEGLWGESLECEESQRRALAGSEGLAENSSPGFFVSVKGLLSSATCTTDWREKLLVLLKEEGEAAADHLKRFDGVEGQSNEGSVAWLLQDAWFVLSVARTPTVASGTPLGFEQSEPTAATETAGAALRAEAAGEALAASADDTAEGGRANVAQKKHRRRGSAASERGGAGEGEELFAEAGRAGSDGNRSSSSSVRGVNSDSGSEVEELESDEGLGWDDDRRLPKAARGASASRRGVFELDSNRRDLFGALHPAGKDTAGGIPSVYAEEGKDTSRQADAPDTKAGEPLVALGDFEAQVVDIEIQDREAAAPFLAGPSTNTSSASAAAARRGEALVYAYLQRQLQQKLADKEAQVLWLNEEQESGQSYDILIKEYPPVGTAAPPSITFVEVKSSSTADKSYFEISHREWNLAQQHGDRFHIYRVLRANSDYAQIFRIVNPYLQWKKKCIGLCIAL